MWSLGNSWNPRLTTALTPTFAAMRLSRVMRSVGHHQFAMTADRENPLLDYILEQTQHFKNECVRIRDKGPLDEYKQLVDALFLVGQKLGTIEHDVAVARLDSEFAHARNEAKDAWKGIWKKFHEGRVAARQTQHELSAHQQEARAQFASLEESYLENVGKHPELDVHFEAVLDAFRSSMEASAPLSKGWTRSPWLFLWADLQIYSVYVRYFVAKVGFFLFRHTIIMIGAILVLGLLYSQTFKLLAEFFAGLAPQEQWIAGAVVVAGYMIKKYYLDSKFKKWQIRLESRRLRFLAYQVHILRTMALAFRTHALPSK